MVGYPPDPQRKDMEGGGRMIIERTVLIPDLHEPFSEKAAVNSVLEFCRYWRPHRVILIGDVVDFGPLSRYVDDPRVEVDLQRQLDAAGDFLDRLRAAVGKSCDIVYIEGNHEFRMTKSLLVNAPKLLWLKSQGEDVLSVPFLLNLKRRGITWIPEGMKVDLHGYLVEHGDCVSSYSGFTAKKMVEKRRRSVIHGHTHRLGSYWHTGYGESVRGIEIGCLVDKKSAAASYAGGAPNWQLGFAVGEFESTSGVFTVTPIEIQDVSGKFIHNGRVFHGQA